MRRYSCALPWFAILAVIALAWAVYAPGLKGGFLFDDFANLPALGAQGPLDNWPSFWRYVTSGGNDPIGRPLAMVSFLADARNWPADPAPFLRTNLLLHLLNGTLLMLLLRRLGRFGGYAPLRADLAAAVGAGLWLLHPLFVSTTLYIVQREAILPATTTLLGLLAWLHGRGRLREGRALTGSFWVALGVGGGTALGVLAKANGALLPIYVTLIEAVLLTSAQPLQGSAQRIYRAWLGCLAWFPSSLLLTYLAWSGVQGIQHGIGDHRPWTLGQRLLTEPRILLDYLGLLWFPRPFTSGLFNDQWQASTGLLAPPSTLVGILAVAALLACAWWLRRRQPALALAIAFFFAGHLIESTTIALELYFEHRNYVPAMLMFWPLALWLCGALQFVHSVSPADAPSLFNDKLRATIAILLIAGLAWMAHARAELWGNAQDQALLWAKLNPDSPRAQASAAQTEMSAGRPDLAVTRLRRALDKAPDQVQLALNLVAARCQEGHVDATTLDAALTALRTTRDAGALLADWFERAIDQSRDPVCPEMDLATVGKLIDAAFANPRLVEAASRRQDLYYLRGRIALVQHQPNLALAEFDRALDQQVRPTAAFQQAALLGSAGYPEQALAHLDHYEAVRRKEATPPFGMPRVHAWVLERQHFWDKELVRLRQTLRDDVRGHSSHPQ